MRPAPLAPHLALLPLALAPALAVACGGASTQPHAPIVRPAPSTSVAEEPRAVWVVVRPTALLREKPGEASVAMRGEVDDAKAEALGDDDAAYALFQRGEERGDFVALETVATAPHGYGCAAPPSALAPFALTLWAKKSGLATVTTRRVRTLYDDGTAVTLAPGVVLHDRGGGFEVRVDAPLVLGVEVPHDARGASFAVARGFDLDAKVVEGFFGAFRLAGKEWAAEVLPDHRSVYGRVETSTGPVATLRTQCAQYEVRPTGGFDEEFGFGGLGLMGTGRGSWKCHFAPARSQLFFRSGEPAGVTRKALQLPDSDEKNRACWTLSLATDGGEHEQAGVRSWAEVCVRTKDAVYGSCPME